MNEGLIHESSLTDHKKFDVNVRDWLLIHRIERHQRLRVCMIDELVERLLEVGALQSGFVQDCILIVGMRDICIEQHVQKSIPCRSTVALCFRSFCHDGPT